MTNKAWNSDVQIDWSALEDLSKRLSEPGVEPGSFDGEQWQTIENVLRSLEQAQDWQAVLHLRNIFDPLFASDTVTGLPLLQRLDQMAIESARAVGDCAELGHLLGAKGHNLHRQGYHLEAIKALDESAENYWAVHENVLGMRSYYMTSLCYRALGNRDRAKQILEEVIKSLDVDDPWQGNPLQVMSWILQDEGKLVEAETLLWKVLDFHRKSTNSDMLIAGTLADLGELVGILGRTDQARELFDESLSIFPKYQGQFDRQEARTLLKFSELLIHLKNHSLAMEYLNRADDRAGQYGHYYDLLWQIELAKAYIYLREGNFYNCLTKLRSVFRYRGYLELSNVLLVQYVVRRYAQRFIKGISAK
jgi:tetratricopeptide (TPR) repeat protein